MAGTILTDSSNLLNRSVSRARFPIAASAQRLNNAKDLLAAMRRIPGVCGERMFRGLKRLVNYNRFVGPAPQSRDCFSLFLCALVAWCHFYWKSATLPQNRSHHLCAFNAHRRCQHIGGVKAT